jgi:hypothetical protein
MHNLHFILVRAESAEKAAEQADSHIDDWGGIDNWFRLGGIASEDGTDDLESFDARAQWPLSFLDKEVGPGPNAGQATYFSRALAYIKRETTQPHVDLKAELLTLSKALAEINPDKDKPTDLWSISYQIRKSVHIMTARFDMSQEDTLEVKSGDYTEFGLTDLTEEQDYTEFGTKRYLVFLDMHF